MGRRIVRIAPALVTEFVTQGAAWGEDRIVRVTEGVPDDATFVRGWYSPEVGADGVFVLLFEHPDWPATDPGAQYPELMPVLTTESIARERTDFVYPRFFAWEYEALMQ